LLSFFYLKTTIFAATTKLYYSFNRETLKKQGICIMICMLSIIYANAQEVIQLPEAQKEGGMPLMETFAQRQSIREYSEREIEMQDLSNLLWAAFGINREGGKRTAPSARNWQEYDLYIVLQNGVYLWNPEANVLTRVIEEDVREMTGKQEFVATAPLQIMLVANMNKPEGKDKTATLNTVYCDAGFISQNIYLFCSSFEMASVARLYYDAEPLHEKLKLEKEQKIILIQTVGYRP
jgi:SagB-type dehydrogenase family enzyme